jgi:ligand-binding SRPBCC domain-containing protein
MLHKIQRKQLVRSDIDKVWKFFSDPANLDLITPDFMNFRILGEKDQLSEMYPGQIIEYYVTPFAGMRMHWVTEITHVVDRKYFVDQQRKGPYSLWHHEHFFKEVGGGVEMTDIVHYQVPFGIFGKIINALVIEKRLNTVFNYRFSKIEEIFS